MTLDVLSDFKPEMKIQVWIIIHKWNFVTKALFKHASCSLFILQFHLSHSSWFQMIRKEGIDTLTIMELQEACRARGMRALGMSHTRLRNQLSQWLELHLDKQIPSSLLLLTRTLYLAEHLSTEDQLKATISSLPETTVSKVEIKLRYYSFVKTCNSVSWITSQDNAMHLTIALS